MADYTVGPLSDGRLQVWAVNQSGELWTRWKMTTDPNAGWSGWVRHDAPTLLSVTAGPLPDGRLHLFALDTGGNSWAAWKITTDPNSAWAEWHQFD
jgi:hypothetical protein